MKILNDAVMGKEVVKHGTMNAVNKENHFQKYVSGKDSRNNLRLDGHGNEWIMPI